MPLVETQIIGQVYIVKINRPERLNALGQQVRMELAQAWSEFRESKDLEVGIFTGTGRAFCAGEDMKEALEVGIPGLREIEIEDPLMSGVLEKPVIAAVNGYAMGGGFMLVEATDLRVAVPEAVFEVSEAKRWLLGGYNHGFIAKLPHPIATEMALGFRFTAQRLYELGFINKLASQEELIPTAIDMAKHMLSLPPASRVNTIQMMRAMRPSVGSDLESLAGALKDHGYKEDLLESRRAFAEKREPKYRGWEDPEDRYNPPMLKE